MRYRCRDFWIDDGFDWLKVCFAILLAGALVQRLFFVARKHRVRFHGCPSTWAGLVSLPDSVQHFYIRWIFCINSNAWWQGIWKLGAWKRDASNHLIIGPSHEAEHHGDCESMMKCNHSLFSFRNINNKSNKTTYGGISIGQLCFTIFLAICFQCPLLLLLLLLLWLLLMEPALNEPLCQNSQGALVSIQGMPLSSSERQRSGTWGTEPSENVCYLFWPKIGHGRICSECISSWSYHTSN